MKYKITLGVLMLAIIVRISEPGYAKTSSYLTTFEELMLGKKPFQKGLGTIAVNVFSKLEKWVTPNPQLRFDQAVFLGSHNSFANKQEGYIYRQQKYSLSNQLRAGVRHFLLDIYFYKGQIMLCHKNCESRMSLLRRGKKLKTFKEYLETIYLFLQENPDQIISIELENYTEGREIKKVLDEISGLNSIILLPEHLDEDPTQKNGRWPKLEELVQMDRRLIFFDLEKGHELFAFHTDRYMSRNMYGVFDRSKACKVRGKEYPHRKLYQLNYFGKITSPLPMRNYPKSLQKTYDRCIEEGVVMDGQPPNFVALDMVQRGNPMKWINQWNRRSAESL